jgi:hypothetical protein
MMRFRLECVRRVNELAEANFKAFIGPETVEMPGHMLRYPLQVGPDGALTPDPDCPSVPDTNASIMGAANAMPEYVQWIVWDLSTWIDPSVLYVRIGAVKALSIRCPHEVLPIAVRNAPNVDNGALR